MSLKSKNYIPPTEHEIACCAYAIFSQEDPQHARELWRQAEAQLVASRQHDAELLKAPQRTVATASRWKKKL